MEKRQSFISRLDENVIVTMLAVSIVACIILAFRNKSREVCVPFTISTLRNQYNAGENIAFETNARPVKKLQWNFGDNRKDETATGSAFHIYNEPGTYLVTLSTDKGCPTEYKILKIVPAPVTTRSSAIIPVFQCPDSVDVGQTVHFKDITPGATLWEWSFGETKMIDATSAAPEYTYLTPGYKKVSLTINNNPEQHNEHNIFVKPKPVINKNNGTGGSRIVVIDRNPTAPPLVPPDDNKLTPPQELIDKREEISPEDLRKRLFLVADKKLTDTDFTPYLAWGNLNIPVELNNDSKISNITFAQFCQILSALKSSKKIKTLDIRQLEKNEGNGIKALKIDFKKKSGILGIG